ncbi:MAG: PAS domain S-box protein [Flavisolibacter sp.]|nr:PAS domain S-box protein [Flavisolibacter sp.]
MTLIKNKKKGFSIKLRIYSSFLLFGFLFLLTAFVVMATVYKTRVMALHIATVVDPSIKRLEDLHNIMLHSKIYSTNWVYLEDMQNDKDSLLKIHSSRYQQIKTNLYQLSDKWLSPENADSLESVLVSCDTILAAQKKVMQLLQSPADYDNPLQQSTAKEIILNTVIPQTDVVTNTLCLIVSKERLIKIEEEEMLEAAFKKLWIIILSSIIGIVFLSVILSKYLTGIIVKPIKQIKSIVDGLALGVTDKITYKYQQNEIGEMVAAVNNLSDRLRYTAFFAKNVGERNYEVPFEPLSDEDVLGKSLVIMRDNLSSMDEGLNQSQHIAKLGNWEWDFKTDKISWSDELYVIFGKDRSDFTPSLDTVIQHIHPDDKNDALSQFDECLRNSKAFSLECRFIIDGTVKYIFAQVNVTVDETSELNKLFGIIQDITERVQKDYEIKKFNKRFHSLSEATNDLVWDWDLTTEEVWWNKNFFKAFNFNPEKGVPALNEWTMKLHPDDKDKVVERLRSIRRSGIESWQDEFRYIKTDGEWGTALDRAYVLKDNLGKPVRIIGAIQDISVRKKAEQETVNSERRYRQIVETAQEGIWLIDENNYTVFVNRKMCEMLEYSAEELTGKLAYDLVDETEIEYVSEQIKRRKAGMAEHHELIFRSKNGKEVWTYVSTNPVVDENGVYRGALAMVTDITTRKQQDELLKKHEASLELKNRELRQKNRELEQFAYIASHDLQEPLRTVHSFSSQLQKQYSGQLDDLAKKYLFFIQQGSERMKTLITDLLDYSRIGRQKELKTIDCNELIENVIADLHTAIQESQVEIQKENLPVVNGYSTEMKQLFQNLISNAIKFRKKEVAPKVQICSQPINGGWEFSVKDNGIGIAEEHNERIFVIFQRLHSRSEYEGTGIGLSHCKKIVELHGGKIWVNSRPGEGSSFHFTILENNN